MSVSVKCCELPGSQYQFGQWNYAGSGAAEAERIKRATKLGRIREPKEETEVIFPTAFYIKEATQQFDDPFQQAEYTYSLIEMEVHEDGS
jgi:hypothetical protein